MKMEKGSSREMRGDASERQRELEQQGSAGAKIRGTGREGENNKRQEQREGEREGERKGGRSMWGGYQAA